MNISYTAGRRHHITILPGGTSASPARTSVRSLSVGGLFVLALAVGCSSADTGVDTDGGRTGTGGVDAADPTTSGDARGTTDARPNPSHDAAPPDAAPPSVVRFIAMGDGGEGNDRQAAVAAAVKVQCDARGGCDFALYLGDNFYNTGVDSVDDQQFIDKFETPYAALDFPFYVVLGNHDYGGDGLGFEFSKGDAQIAYSDKSTKWTLPSHFYTKSVGVGSTSVDIFGLDTNNIFYLGDDPQAEWLDGALAASMATWKIAYGHHTYISNGKHGNAGTYEGIPFVPILSGGSMKDFVEDHVCGSIDVYFCGHDHNRQWLEPTCGTEFVVSGAAAKHTDLEGRGTPTFYEDDQLGGFALIEIDGNTLTGWFYDETGAMNFTRTVTK